MHVGLIAHRVPTTGSARYMEELLNALISRHPTFEYTLFTEAHPFKGTDLKPQSHLRLWPVPSRSPWLRQLLGLPLAIRQSRVQLVHSQYALPATVACPAVVTVHDVFFARRPDLYPFVVQTQLRYRVPRALRKARVIIVPSQFTKREILSIYRVPAHKLRVIPHGIASRFRPLPARVVEPVRHRYALPGRFFLFLGALQPRKNLLRLIGAFNSLDRATRRAYPLVICGPPRWMYQEVLHAGQSLVDEGTLRFLGQVPDADVPALFNLATTFVFPSLSEGFGFPVLEAMRCGTPVVAANTGSIPELVGKAAILVDPHDIRQLSEALQFMIDDTGRRTRLSTAGRVRASTYTWASCADLTAAAYEAALLAGPHSTMPNDTLSTCVR